MNKLIMAVGCVLCGLSVLAESYVLSADTKIGAGEDLYLGSDAFPYDGFTFDFSSGADSLHLVNKVNLNGKNITIKIPNNKTVYFQGGLENNVEFNTATEETAGGEILSVDTSYRGTLVVSNTSVNVRTRPKYGTMRYEGGTFTLGRVQVWDSGNLILKDSTVTARGTVVLGNGTITMENCAFTKAANSSNPYNFNVSVGAVYQKGGSFTMGGSGRFWLGGTSAGETNNNGYYELSDGGTFRVGSQLLIGYYGKGTFVLKGGKVTNDGYNQIRHYVGMEATGVGTLDICGGEYELKAGQFSASDGFACIVVGNSGTGTLKVSDGGRFTVVKGDGDGASRRYAKVIVAQNSGAKGTIVVNEGGTFSTWRGPVGGAGVSSFVFNGGSYVGIANTEQSAFTDIGSVKVGALGGEFQCENGSGVYTIPLPLVAEDSTAAAAGVFKKTGPGKLVLSGANSYNVPTVASAGTLALATGATFSSSSMLSVDAAATVDFGSTAQTIGGVGMLAGTLANVTDLTFAGETQPGGAGTVGTTTLNCSSLTFAAGSKLVIERTDDACDKLVVNCTGAVDLSNLTIEVAEEVGRDVSKIGPVLSIPSGVTGKPTVRVGGRRWLASVDANGNVTLGRSGLILVVH